jgi:hypothetical protein
VLEDLALPSCTATFGAGVLTVADGGKSDHVVIEDHGNLDGSAVVRVLCNGKLIRQVEGDLVNAVIVNTKGGNDSVDYQLLDKLTGLTNPGRNVNVNFGKGNSIFTTEIGTLIGGAQLNLDVVGGQGNDTMIANAEGDLYGASALHITFEGQQSSRCTEILNATAPLLGITPGVGGLFIGNGSALVTTFLGGTGKNTIVQNFAGQLNGTLNLSSNGGAGKALINSLVALDPKSGTTAGFPNSTKPSLFVDETGGDKGGNLLELYVNPAGLQASSFGNDGLQLTVDGGGGSVLTNHCVITTALPHRVINCS